MVVLPELCYQCCVKHVVLKNPLCVPSSVFRICFDNLAWFVRLYPAKGAAAAEQRLICPVSQQLALNSAEHVYFVFHGSCHRQPAVYEFTSLVYGLLVGSGTAYQQNTLIYCTIYRLPSVISFNLLDLKFIPFGGSHCI